jgi:hypothetical protein
MHDIIWLLPTRFFYFGFRRLNANFKEDRAHGNV